LPSKKLLTSSGDITILEGLKEFIRRIPLILEFSIAIIEEKGYIHNKTQEPIRSKEFAGQYNGLCCA
jgi:hypothetical protein